MPLSPPSKGFPRLALPTVPFEPADLVRITRFDSGEPYFGRTGGNRFDDTRFKKRPARRFGTCYAGSTLDVAFAETVLHDEVAVDGRFEIDEDALESRLVVRFSGKTLTLADLTGLSLKVIGADGSLSTISPYDLPQRWSVAVHEHRARVDGAQYVSRHLNTGVAVVLFDRAAAKIASTTYTPLPDYPGALRTVLKFKVKPA
jgi:hypothetical protein